MKWVFWKQFWQLHISFQFFGSCVNRNPNPIVHRALWQVFALSRDGGVPYSKLLRKVDPRAQVPVNAVWCAAICAMLLGLPILKLDVVFTAITSICTIGWVGGYAVPIFARMVIKTENFKPGPFQLGHASRGVCLIAFLWICYTCVIFLVPTTYPIRLETFNYAPVALGIVLTIVMGWWILDARHWFKGPVREIFKLPDWLMMLQQQLNIKGVFVSFKLVLFMTEYSIVDDFAKFT